MHENYVNSGLCDNEKDLHLAAGENVSTGILGKKSVSDIMEFAGTEGVKPKNDDTKAENQF